MRETKGLGVYNVAIIGAGTAGLVTAATLDSVADSKRSKEVIVVDAGSVDGTSDLARARDSRVLFSPWRQRAYQINLGARHAQLTEFNRWIAHLYIWGILLFIVGYNPGNGAVFSRFCFNRRRRVRLWRFLGNR